MPQLPIPIVTPYCLPGQLPNKLVCVLGPNSFILPKQNLLDNILDKNGFKLSIGVCDPLTLDLLGLFCRFETCTALQGGNKDWIEWRMRTVHMDRGTDTGVALAERHGRRDRYCSQYRKCKQAAILISAKSCAAFGIFDENLAETCEDLVQYWVPQLIVIVESESSDTECQDVGLCTSTHSPLPNPKTRH